MRLFVNNIPDHSTVLDYTPMYIKTSTNNGKNLQIGGNNTSMQNIMTQTEDYDIHPGITEDELSYAKI